MKQIFLQYSTGEPEMGGGHFATPSHVAESMAESSGANQQKQASMTPYDKTFSAAAASGSPFACKEWEKKPEAIPEGNDIQNPWDTHTKWLEIYYAGGKKILLQVSPGHAGIYGATTEDLIDKQWTVLPEY